VSAACFMTWSESRRYKPMRPPLAGFKQAAGGFSPRNPLRLRRVLCCTSAARLPPSTLSARTQPACLLTAKTMYSVVSPRAHLLAAAEFCVDARGRHNDLLRGECRRASRDSPFRALESYWKVDCEQGKTSSSCVAFFNGNSLSHWMRKMPLHACFSLTLLARLSARF
jgi:hypothetical protein